MHSSFCRISSYYIVNSVCWSHALVNGPTSKRPASDGGLCSGQLLMMWSAVAYREKTHLAIVVRSAGSSQMSNSLEMAGRMFFNKL